MNLGPIGAMLRKGAGIPRRPVVHPSKPVWIDRIKNKDGSWTAVPHYKADPEVREAVNATKKRR